MTARIVPFGVAVPYGDATIQFTRGSIEYGDRVPLTVDHGELVGDRVGVMSTHFETDDGAYARFVLADTAAGRDLHAQLMLGAVRDVSVGVVVPERPTGDATLAGVLDHVSIVTRGRFGRTDNPAAVLAVIEAA